MPVADPAVADGEFSATVLEPPQAARANAATTTAASIAAAAQTDLDREERFMAQSLRVVSATLRRRPAAPVWRSPKSVSSPESGESAPGPTSTSVESDGLRRGRTRDLGWNSTVRSPAR